MHGNLKYSLKNVSQLQSYQVTDLLQSLLWFINERIWVKLRGNCLIRIDKPFTNRNVVNLFPVWELDAWSKEFNADSTPGLFNPSYTKLIDDLSVEVTLIFKN